MLRIGVLWPQGDSWTAGAIYYDNLLRSILLAGEAREEAGIAVLEPRGGDFSARTANSRLDGVRYFDYQATYSDLGVRRVIDLARGRLGLPAAPFAKAIRRSAIDVLFGNVDTHRRALLPWISWIPDFQHKIHPQYFSQDECELRDRLYLRWASHSSLLMLSSRDAQTDFHRFAPSLMGRERVLPFVSLFPEEFFDEDAESVAQRLNVQHPYVIVPNQWWRHKDHETAIRAAARLKGRGIQITWVFTGALSDYRAPDHTTKLLQLISELNLSSHVRVLGRLSRRDQVQLMRSADLIVQPSRFEGWSTVVEDARTLGQRIVLSDIAVHREQNPPNSIFFAAGSPEDLAGSIERALAGEVNRSDEVVTRCESLARARVFGRRFIEICREAVGLVRK